ncbi:hypothetical protein ACFQX8_18025 [Klenkia terrae]|uniref:hypothetical protein n=1 Tax=Klenkia terrae TaxID=1052259 RepID=UPI00360FE938
MSFSPRTGAAATVVVAALLLAGCAAGDGTSAAIPQTGPGVELALGEPAVLSLDFLPAGASPVELTVDGVRRGTEEELDTLGLGGAADGMLPFSVDVSLRRLAGDDGTPAGTLESDLDVVLATGTPSLTAVELDAPSRAPSVVRPSRSPPAPGTRTACSWSPLPTPRSPGSSSGARDRRTRRTRSSGWSDRVPRRGLSPRTRPASWRRSGPSPRSRSASRRRPARGSRRRPGAGGA